MQQIQDMTIEEIKQNYVVSRFIKHDLGFKYSHLTSGYNKKYFLTLEDFLNVCDENKRVEIKDTIELYEFHNSRFVELEKYLLENGFGVNGLDSLYEYITYKNKWNQRLLSGEITISDIN